MYDTNINKDRKEAEGKEEVLARVLHPQLGCALPSFLPKKGRVSHLRMPSFPVPFTHCLTLVDLCPVVLSVFLWRPEFPAVLSSQLQ